MRGRERKKRELTEAGREVNENKMEWEGERERGREKKERRGGENEKR